MRVPASRQTMGRPWAGWGAAMVLLLAAGPLASAGDTATGPPLAVYVTGRTATAAEAEQAAAAAAKSEAAVALEAALETQYGKNRKAWPRDKRVALYEANEEARLSREEASHLDVELKGIEASVPKVRKKLAGKTIVRVVEGPEQADLVAEILGRQYDDARGVVITFRLRPGPALDAALLAKQTLKVPNVFMAAQEELHSYTPEEPFWDFEISAQISLRGWAEGQVAAKIDAFIKANHAALLASRAARGRSGRDAAPAVKLCLSAG